MLKYSQNHVIQNGSLNIECWMFLIKLSLKCVLSLSLLQHVFPIPTYPTNVTESTITHPSFVLLFYLLCINCVMSEYL